MTGAEVISAIRNLVTSFEGVTDFSLSDAQIAAERDTLRARMIIDLDNHSLFRRPYTGFLQKIESIAVVRAADRSLSVTLPRMIIKRDATPAYEYIGGKDMKSPYRVVTSEQDYENALHMPFIGTRPICLYEEGKITIRNGSADYIRVVGVFEHPPALEVLDYYDEETNEYPMPSGPLDMLIGKQAESYLRMLYRVPVQPNTQSDIPNARRVNK